MKFVDSADVSPRDIIQLLWIFLQNKMVSRCSTVWNEVSADLVSVKYKLVCSAFALAVTQLSNPWIV